MSEIHQQNSETRQTPVLTLDPSSVAKEKVQMEETTQQLEAMAQAGAQRDCRRTGRQRSG